MLVLLFADLLNELVNDGKVKYRTYSFSAALVSTTITIGLLTWGGFFG